MCLSTKYYYGIHFSGRCVCVDLIFSSFLKLDEEEEEENPEDQDEQGNLRGFINDDDDDDDEEEEEEDDRENKAAQSESGESEDEVGHKTKKRCKFISCKPEAHNLI